MNDELLPAELSLVPEPFSDDAIDGTLIENGGEAVMAKRWFPEDDDAAEWAMRKLAAAVDDERAVVERADAYRERIAAWEETERARPARRRLFFKSLLERYGLVQREATDRKTINLPSGTISTRGRADEQIVLTDPAALLEWANTRGNGVRAALTETKLKSVTELRKVLVTYLDVECIDCSHRTITLTPGPCPACGVIGSWREVGRVVAIPKFGLEDTEPIDEYLVVPGVKLEPAPPATASVALAGERALPKGD